MRQRLFLGALFVGLAQASQAQPAAAPDQPDHEHAGKKVRAGELIIQFKAEASDEAVADALAAGGLEVRKHVQTHSMKTRGHHGVTHVSTRLNTEEALGRLKQHPAVEFVEPNFIYTHQATANDPYYNGGYLWGAYGQKSAPANAYGSAVAEAWAAGYVGQNSVYVGVIDEGVQVTHPELAPNAWTNPYDPVDGVDNDGNGYVDDSRGWDFAANKNVVFDAATDDHGTHVAGTIGARGGNALGVAGVNWNVTLIAGKFLGASGGTTLDAVEAIDYFTDLKQRHGLNIVALNASWGGSGYSQALHDAVLRAAKAGILFIAAAGNGDSAGQGLNNDANAFYPANYDTRQGTSTEAAASYDSVICVAAIDANGAKATFSNYGATRVDLGAPGVGIYSTLPTDTFGAYSGTSMATPHVTGAAALYASTHPGSTAAQIRAALLGSVIPTPSLAGLTVTGGRLNLGSIIAPPVALPPAPTGLTATGGNQRVTLAWPSVSGATSYVVKRSTTRGGPYAQVAAGLTSPGYADTAGVNGTTYYYVVAAVNASGPGPDSSEASTTPQAPVVVPAAPAGVSASADQATVSGNAAVAVRWNASSGATRYNVKRASSASGPWTTIISGATTRAITNTVSANGTPYFYAVSALNTAGESANSTAAGVTPLSPAPANLAATTISRTQINIAWADRSADEQGFKVEYSLNGSTWTQLGTVGIGRTSASITGFASNTTYWFRIRAYNGTSNTAYSNTTSAKTLP